MRTITIHISDETAAALEVDSTRLQMTEMYLTGVMMQLKAQHGDKCDVAGCQLQASIDEAPKSIDIVGRIARFQHDVLAAYRLAPAEVE